MELSVLDLGSNLVTAVPLQAEPLFLALGETHVACGMNNQAWFYDLSVVSDETQAPRLVNQREYLGVVTAVAMGAVYAIALSEGTALRLSKSRLQVCPYSYQKGLLPLPIVRP
jgi:hypothetical protein